MHQCSYCRSFFTTKGNCTRHFKENPRCLDMDYSFIKNDNRLLCLICMKTLPDQTSIIKHMCYKHIDTSGELKRFGFSEAALLA